MALLQASKSDMMTKAKPLERCVLRSRHTVDSTTVPNLGGGQEGDVCYDWVVCEAISLIPSVTPSRPPPHYPSLLLPYIPYISYIAYSPRAPPPPKKTYRPNTSLRVSSVVS